jgi:PAS domain-containing protein
MLLISGERARIQAQVKDSTSRLRDREARLQAILDKAADAIVTIDGDGVWCRPTRPGGAVRLRAGKPDQPALDDAWCRSASAKRRASTRRGWRMIGRRPEARELRRH